MHEQLKIITFLQMSKKKVENISSLFSRDNGLPFAETHDDSKTMLAYANGSHTDAAVRRRSGL